MRKPGSKAKPVATGVYLHVPETFHAERFPELIGYENAANWLLHKIITTGHRHKHDPWYDGMAHISRQTMKRYMHATAVSRVRDALIGHGVIVCNESYQRTEPGRPGYSQSYALTPAYCGGLREVEVTSDTLANRMRADRIALANRPVTEAELDQTLSYLLRCLRETHIDVEQAYEIIDGQPDQPPRITKRKVGRRGRKRIIRTAIPSPKVLNRLTVETIAREEWDFVTCRYGRLHTPATRLATACRAALSIDGHPLGAIDIRNSQLVFFLLLLQEARYGAAAARGGSSTADAHGPTNGEYTVGPAARIGSISALPFDPFRASPETPGQATSTLCGSIYPPPTATPTRPPTGTTSTLCGSIYDPSDSKKEAAGTKGINIRDGVLQPDEIAFREAVLDGSIYDRLMAHTGYTDRRKFKGDFFEAVLYGDNSKPYSTRSPIARHFRNLYPTVWQFVLDQKRHDYRELARNMQRRESRFLIGRVCGRLAQHHSHVRVVTIHDSIMTPVHNLPLIERIIREEFDRIGVQPALHYDLPMRAAA